MVSDNSTKQTERKFLVTLSSAQDDMLNKLSKKTGRSKAYLVREAVNQILGAYREILTRENWQHESWWYS